MSLYNDRKARVRGIAQGRKVTTYDLLRDWCIQQKVLECRIPGYDEDQITRFAFVDVSDKSIEVLQDGGQQVVTSASELILRRVDFISEFGPPD